MWTSGQLSSKGGRAFGPKVDEVDMWTKWTLNLKGNVSKKEKEGERERKSIRKAKFNRVWSKV